MWPTPLRVPETCSRFINTLRSNELGGKATFAIMSTEASTYDADKKPLQAPQKRHFHGKIGPNKKPKKQPKRLKRASGLASDSVFNFVGGHDDFLAADIRCMLRERSQQVSDYSTGSLNVSDAAQKPFALPERWSEIEVHIDRLSSTGDGLGQVKGSNHTYVVPFTAPGDVVLAKVVHHNILPHAEPSKVENTTRTDTDQIPPHTLTDFLKLLKPSHLREDTVPRCRYFTQCGGCMLQHLPNHSQLAQKTATLRYAYANFSGLPPSAIPVIPETIASPLQYGYRTKLTPHFDGPRGGRKANRRGEKPEWDKVPAIGYMRKGGKRETLDIEQCVIGSEAVNRGLVRERQRVARELDKYRRGATLLLRESTAKVNGTHVENDANEPMLQSNGEEGPVSEIPVAETVDSSTHVKTCITDNNAYATEYVDGYTFRNKANAFFQNNNSILPRVVQYIHERIHEGPGTKGESDEKDRATDTGVTNLIDAYCGSGLFTITLSPIFQRSIGVDISPQSVADARENLKLNGLSQAGEAGRIGFITADASALFESVPETLKPENTAVILDPPRKGSDEGFLKQLVDFGPERIVYVSCNVGTQARDVGWILRGGNSPAMSDHLKHPTEAIQEIPGDIKTLGGDYEIETSSRRRRTSRALQFCGVG